MARKKNRAHKSTNENRFDVQSLLTVILVAVLLAIVTLVVVIIVLNAKPESAPTRNPQETTATEDLTQDEFLLGYQGLEETYGGVTGTQEANEVFHQWDISAKNIMKYHMTILEKERVNADQNLVQVLPGYALKEWTLAETQTRKIEIFCGYGNKTMNRYYLVVVEEQNFAHPSQTKLLPGVYFFSDKKSSTVKTSRGEVTGEEAQTLKASLEQYLIYQYCNPSVLAGRVGENLTVTDSIISTDQASILLEGETETVIEMNGTRKHIDSLNATYMQNEGTIAFEVSVVVDYEMENFDTDAINIQCQLPDQKASRLDKLKTWDGEESYAMATLMEVKDANEIWKELSEPEQFYAQVSYKTTGYIQFAYLTQVQDKVEATVQHMMVDGEVYTKLKIKYPERQIGVTNLAAGTYVLSKDFIWTEKGVLAVKEAPDLYAILSGYITDAQSSKQLIARANAAYVESIDWNINSQTSQISLVAKTANGERSSDRAVIKSKDGKLSNVQVRTERLAQTGVRVDTSFEVKLDYQQDKLCFTIPS